MRSARSNRLGFCWKSGIVARTVMAWLTGAAGCGPPRRMRPRAGPRRGRTRTGAHRRTPQNPGRWSGYRFLGRSTSRDLPIRCAARSHVEIIAALARYSPFEGGPSMLDRRDATAPLPRSGPLSRPRPTASDGPGQVVMADTSTRPAAIDSLATPSSSACRRNRHPWCTHRVSPLVVHAVGVPGSRARRLACERVEPGAEAVGLRRGRIAVALRCCSARARR